MDSPETVIAKGRWLGKWVRFNNLVTGELVIGQVEYVRVPFPAAENTEIVLSTTAGETTPEYVREER